MSRWVNMERRTTPETQQREAQGSRSTRETGK
ncbi:hypothetical protein OIU79_014991 [Salix purpurea]|uniref:Uncharacterized protein n=1 Tax=Salix purpurea TaxID=77065 RepID=A0A9Q0PAN8_SALPP|nr:hypothetical protein OIU79_014991 [Salix purpurea]